jgi:transcriptional regulator with XRE-family HTH domain
LLVAWRERIRPEEHGLLVVPGHHRAPGLSQEQFALLIGWTARHYGEFERGEMVTAPEAVLEQIVRLAKLSDGERHALYCLGAGHPPAPPPTPDDPAEFEGLRELVARLGPLPTMVTDLAWNLLLWSDGVVEWFQDPATVPLEDHNVMLWLFSEAAAQRIVGIEQERADMLGRLRGCYAMWPGEPRFEALIARLREIPNARAIWDRGEIRDQPVVQVRTVRHPLHGELVVPSVTTDLPRGLRLIIFMPPVAATLP